MYIEKRFASPPAGLGATIAALILLGLGVDASLAAQTYAGEVQTKYQYAAKVLCSLLTPHQDGDLAQGTYRTAINVHNPTDKEVTFVHKVALGTAPGTPPGDFSVTPFRAVTLEPDGAVLVNCGTVAGFFCPINRVCVDFAFLDGFLVIRSPVELDVVAVYTARHTEGEVETIDVEAVPARELASTVKVPSDEQPPKVDERIEYPHKPFPGYGKQICGGIAGIPCPAGKMCVDDPSDDCDPEKGGADCPGVCSEVQQCGGIAGLACPNGRKCVDDPSDDCDPQKGGADCIGICVESK